MANHKQAEKRNRQREKRSELNRHFRATMRTLVKRLRSALEEKDKKEAVSALGAAVPMIDRLAQKGMMPKRRASRLVSRLSSQVAKLA